MLTSDRRIEILNYENKNVILIIRIDETKKKKRRMFFFFFFFLFWLGLINKQDNSLVFSIILFFVLISPLIMVLILSYGVLVILITI